MHEEHLMEHEVEECATLREKVKEGVDQVKPEYDAFKMNLNTPMISNRSGSR